MAVGPWILHNAYKEYEGDGTVDLDNDTFALRLYSSSSNVGDVTVSAGTAVTNELPTANGYTSGGITLSTAWTRVAGVCTFEVTAVSFPVSTANFVARFAAVIDVSADVVVAHMLLDATPADIIIEPGADFDLLWPNGLFSKQ